MRPLILAAALFFAITSMAWGQAFRGPDYAEGELMVQLREPGSLARLISDYNGFGLTSLHTVSARFNIYLLGFDPARASNSTMMTALKKEESVVNVQHNHRLSLRETSETMPDDSLFYHQWALRNIGQNGGKYGADIDATDAWDITTGGLTAHGDTIVVAVIDGGSDVNHEDLVHWKNHGEIPDNNIDDDSNGYIDDYDGWNAFNHNGTIPLSNHGVHVGGIIGATGNNEIGVAGVNWSMKILPVAGASTTESVVVEALSYVYVVRERYDTTGGAAGAFVVAANCSFGVDLGQPEDFPIWEAMYDSLGELGILNIAATANRAWDIDSVGDVPTAFETDYMISVTNTTNKDVHYANSGYGDTTIDLGAPGSLIRSLRINNNYGNSSGTSMATPHVAGAVALLFAAADSAFIADYKAAPGEQALKIKEYILNGVDSLETLAGKTVSGGRLNVFKSMNLLLNAPYLTLNADSMYAELPLDALAYDTMLLTNSGGDTLDYAIDIDELPEWLSLSRTQGSLASQETDTIVLTFSSEGMDTGYYSTLLSIKGENIPDHEMPAGMLVYTNVGVDEPEAERVRLTVYPNPFTTDVTFGILAGEQGNVTIEVFDNTGRQIFLNSSFVNKGTNNIHWTDRSDADGLYFYRISLNGRLIHSGKLMKF